MTCRSIDKTKIEIDTKTVNNFVTLNTTTIKLEYLAVGRDVGRLVGWTDGATVGFFVGTLVGAFDVGFIDGTASVADVTEWIPQRQRINMTGCHSLFIDVFIFVLTVCNRSSQRNRSQSYGSSWLL